jgi:hypothetical protein
VESILIANEKGREAFLNHNRLPSIIFPAIQATSRLTATEILFFPTSLSTGSITGPRTTAHPLRLIPIRSVTPAPTTPRGLITETLQCTHLRTLPSRPLKLAELCGDLETGIEAFLKTSYEVASYT